MKIHSLTTSFAKIAVRDSAGDGPVILLIHGNSSCKEVFRHQFDSPRAKRFRLLAMDLPGHGESENAPDPATAYTISGYARAAVEVLRQMGAEHAVIFGWSLGGHVALDMISRFPGLLGVMISGTPPVPGSMEGVALGFQQNAHMMLASSGVWSDEDAETYARATAGANAPFEPFMLDAARRTHAIAREIFFANALSGGADDAFINGAYFGTLHYANLWDGKVHALKGIGHAPFWEAPGVFNPLLERFAADASRAR